MNYFFVILIICHVSLRPATSNDVRSKDVETTLHENANQSIKVPNAIKPPTILIVTLFRNKAHIMPLFFTYLNRIEYPKQRISLW